MLSTRFTDLVGCEVPIQLAPLGGGIGTLELAEAVAGAGGHAMLGLTSLPAPVVEQLIEAVEQRAIRAYGVNLLVPFLDHEVLELVASRVPVVDFYLGMPAPELVDVVHAGGALVQWQVCSREEAVAAQAAGCDLIVAHGVEAGGRNPGGIGLIPLLEQVLPAVSVPVIAAGGIATGRGIAAVLSMGAAGARLGTRFVAATESGAHADYVAAVVAAGSEDAVHTSVFDAAWPAPEVAGSRALRGSAESAEAATEEVIGELALPDGRRAPIARFAPSPPSTAASGLVAAMPMYAGQSVGSVTRVQPAAEIVSELAAEAEAALGAAGALMDGGAVRAS